MLAGTGHERLEELRRHADPLADSYIDGVFAQGRVDAVNEVLDGFLERGDLDPALTRPALREYLRRSGWPPPWQDDDLLRRGGEFFVLHGPLILISLVTASLAECYAMRNGVQVLALTRRMGPDHIYRRVYETAQFVVDAMMPGGLLEHGRGLRAAQRVRLMHAAIRHLILRPRALAGDGHHHDRPMIRVLGNERWDGSELGVPINQEDMGYTLLTFSLVILRSLERLGVDVDRDEARAWFHRWAVIGHHMGIKPELLDRMRDRTTAEDLFARIQAHQVGASPEGVRMTAALPVFFARVLRSRVVGPRLCVTLIRTLVPPRIADGLGVPRRTPWESAAIGVAQVLLGMLDGLFDLLRRDFRCTGFVQNCLGKRLITGLTALPRGWRRDLFDIPTRLAVDWKARPHRPRR